MKAPIETWECRGCGNAWDARGEAEATARHGDDRADHDPIWDTTPAVMVWMHLWTTNGDHADGAEIWTALEGENKRGLLHKKLDEWLDRMDAEGDTADRALGLIEIGQA